MERRTLTDGRQKQYSPTFLPRLVDDDYCMLSEIMEMEQNHTYNNITNSIPLILCPNSEIPFLADGQLFGLTGTRTFEF